jgi:nifR3 family TIM-barrel protein
MADVTDAPFRELISRIAKPDVIWTEFTSADGLVSGGKEALLYNLKYSPLERPIVAKLFGARPEKMEEAATLVATLGFDGIDINMGCPDRAIERQGAGAALIQDPPLAREILRAVKRGAPELPFSVKTRLGYNTDVLESWLPELLAEEPAAITVHARTRKEMSKVPARWERVRRAVEIRNESGSHTLILGNGDVASIADAKEKVLASGADGVMLGRAIFGNPWLFSKTERKEDKTLEEILLTLLRHAKLFDEHLSGHKSFAVMRKHFKSYITGFPHAKELREALMEATDSNELAKVIDNFLKK